MSQTHYPAKIVKFSCYIQNENGTKLIPSIKATFSHTIDELPSVTVEAQLDNTGTKDLGLDLKKFCLQSQEFQRYLVNKLRLVCDFFVLAEDGDSNPLKFQGFLTNPFFSFQEDALILRYTGIHKMAGLQGFNATIYNFPEYYAHTDSTTPGATGVTLIPLEKFQFSPDSLADRINTMVLSLVNNFQTKVTIDPLSGKDTINFHKMNRNAYANFVMPLLQKSFNTTVIPYSGYIEGRTSMHQEPCLNYELSRVLFSSENFLAAIPEFCEMFKFQFNANWSGDAWLEIIRTHQDTEGRVIQVPISDVSFNVAAGYEIPLIKVFVYNSKGAYYGGPGDLLPSNSPAISVLTAAATGAFISGLPANFFGSGALKSPDFIAYPDVEPGLDELGVFYTVVAPNWVAQDATFMQAVNDAVDRASLVPAAGLSALDAKKKLGAKMYVERANLLRWIAKHTYEEHLLKYAQASMTIPFCAQVQVGLTYDVKSADGTFLFSGYLASAVHSLEQNGPSASAQTQLVFTHVKTPGLVMTRTTEDPFWKPDDKEAPVLQSTFADPSPTEPSPPSTIQPSTGKPSSAPVVTPASSPVARP